jgi:hypothetical protein
MQSIQTKNPSSSLDQCVKHKINDKYVKKILLNNLIIGQSKYFEVVFLNCAVWNLLLFQQEKIELELKIEIIDQT